MDLELGLLSVARKLVKDLVHLWRLNLGNFKKKELLSTSCPKKLTVALDFKEL
jgi:hypothetical protein